jgi:large subunit ribosomal protein L17
MKHKKLNRDSNARVALFTGLISSLIDHESVDTTAAKAKVVRGMFEKMLTKARDGSVHVRRQIQGVVQDSSLVSKLVTDIAPRYTGVSGGYTKTIMVGNRRGDNAPIVRLMLTKKAAVVAKGDMGKKSLVKKGKTEDKKGKESADQPIMTAPRTAKPTHQKVAGVTKGAIGTKRGDR